MLCRKLIIKCLSTAETSIKSKQRICQEKMIQSDFECWRQQKLPNCWLWPYNLSSYFWYVNLYFIYRWCSKRYKHRHNTLYDSRVFWKQFTTRPRRDDKKVQSLNHVYWESQCTIQPGTITVNWSFRSLVIYEIHWF